MQVKNAVAPGAGQAHGFFSTAPDGPLVMVNLLRFKDKADYPDGRDPGLSGREAYMRYAKGVRNCLEQVGGRPLFSGPVTGLLLGEIEEPWHMVALAWYPEASALLKMVALPDYRAIEVHRLAGLEGQLNIRTTPAMVQA